MVEGSFHGFVSSRVVAVQLDREPAIDYEVVVACSYGWPALIRNKPFDRRGNFNPNLYYLTCPYLVKRISTLEDESHISKLQQLMEDDSSLLADVSRAQEMHAAEWIDAAVRAGGRSRGDIMQDIARGAPRIADASDDKLLKCLHAHYAFLLVHVDYSLGKLIESRIGRRWCDDERCQGMMEKGVA